MLHVDAWTAFNVWLHTEKANYRIVKCSGVWHITQESKPGREWLFITGKTFETSSEAVQELETMLHVKAA